MALLITDPMPDYIMIVPLFYVGLFVLVVLAVAVFGGRRSSARGKTYGGRGGRSSRKRSSGDDLWLAAYLSELHREQYHHRR